MSSVPKGQEKEGQSLPPGSVRNPVAWALADVDLDDVGRSLERGDKHPGLVAGLAYAVEATGIMFGVYQGDRVYTTWVATLTCLDKGSSYRPLVVVGSVGRDSSESECVVLENPARGWGRGVPWKVPWEGPQSEV